MIGYTTILFYKHEIVELAMFHISINFKISNCKDYIYNQEQQTHYRTQSNQNEYETSKCYMTT